MKDICRVESCKNIAFPNQTWYSPLQSTVPSDYEELLAYYTHRGFRVIACATKHIAKLNWVKVQKMKREEAESGLDFLGFIIFENKLKPSTAGVLDELSEAGIRKVMCTGDNILTAISVARECNLIDKTAHCFVPHFAEGSCSDLELWTMLMKPQEISKILKLVCHGKASIIIYSHLMRILFRFVNATSSCAPAKLVSLYRHQWKEMPRSLTISLISGTTPLQLVEMFSGGLLILRNQ